MSLRPPSARTVLATLALAGLCAVAIGCGTLDAESAIEALAGMPLTVTPTCVSPEPTLADAPPEASSFCDPFGPPGPIGASQVVTENVSAPTGADTSAWIVHGLLGQFALKYANVPELTAMPTACVAGEMNFGLRSPLWNCRPLRAGTTIVNCTFAVAGDDVGAGVGSVECEPAPGVMLEPPPPQALTAAITASERRRYLRFTDGAPSIG